MTTGTTARCPAVAGRQLTIPIWCDASHRMSFTKWGIYSLLTTAEFNMCNCTTPAVRPGPFRPELPQTSRTLTSNPEQARAQPLVDAHGHP
jgi:hypothetical protein